MLLYRQRPPADTIDQVVAKIEETASPRGAGGTLVYVAFAPAVISERTAMRDFANIVQPQWVKRDGVDIEENPIQLVSCTHPNHNGISFVYAVSDKQTAEIAYSQLKLRTAFQDAGMHTFELSEDDAIRAANARLDTRRSINETRRSMMAAIDLLR